MTRVKKKRKLIFEEESIPIGEAKWNKPKKPTVVGKTTDTARAAVVNKLHSKVYEVEHENIGTKAAHRAELLTESAYRGAKKATHSAYRFVKNTPYRRAAKLELKSIKNESRLSFQKVIRDNPALKNKPLSRLFQKRAIKRQYAAAFKKANDTLKTAKRSVGAVSRVTKAASAIVRRNPVLLLQAGLLLLIIIMVMSLFTMCFSLFSGGAGYVGDVSFAASDEAVDQVELSYTEWETNMKMEIRNAESTHNGYDEYRYNVGEIGHDPIELMAFLTAVYGDFSYAKVEPVLRDIFAEQYQLEFIPETEIRVRTETRMGSYIDPDSGATVYYDYNVDVEYEWRVLNTVLVSKPLSQVIYPLMTNEQRAHYSILLHSRGARQIVGNPFGVDWKPYISSHYGYRVHPITGVKDFHKGVDIALPTGTDLLAVFDGKVITVGYDAGGYGNYVVIEDKNGVQAKYAHCSSVYVSEGQTVEHGETIAAVGSTGSSTGPHLHFEVVKDGAHINPLFFSESAVNSGV